MSHLWPIKMAPPNSVMLGAGREMLNDSLYSNQRELNRSFSPSESLTDVRLSQ